MNYGVIKPIYITSKELNHEEPIHGLSEVTFTIRARTTLDAQQCAILLDTLMQTANNAEA